MDKQESKEVFYAAGGGLVASFLFYIIWRQFIPKTVQPPVDMPSQPLNSVPTIPQQPQVPRQQLLTEINQVLNILLNGTAEQLQAISIPGYVDLSTASQSDRRYLWNRLKYTTDRAYYQGPRQEPYPTNDTGIALHIIRDDAGNIHFAPIFYEEYD